MPGFQGTEGTVWECFGKKGRFQEPQTDQSLLKDHWTKKGPSVYPTLTSPGSTIQAISLPAAKISSFRQKWGWGKVYVWISIPISITLFLFLAQFNFSSICNTEKFQGEVSIILCLFYVMIITSLKYLTDPLSLIFDKCLEECILKKKTH